MAGRGGRHTQSKGLGGGGGAEARLKVACPGAPAAPGLDPTGTARVGFGTQSATYRRHGLLPEKRARGNAVKPGAPLLHSGAAPFRAWKPTSAGGVQGWGPSIS